MIRLNENDSAAEQHYHIVKDLIKNRVYNILNGNIKRDKTIITPSASLTAYLNTLLNDIDLKSLIIAKADALPSMIARLKTTDPNFFIQGEVDNYILRNIFISHCYDNPSFSKLEFIKRIPIDTCPYCNRNYIYHLDRAGSIKPQIDHFFPKTIYPFLSASFYNLIPSCQTCNGFGAKEEKDPLVHTLINPYLLDKKNLKFIFNIISINFLDTIRDKAGIEIDFENPLPGHLDVFKLKELYSQHADHVSELIIKGKSTYSSEYRKYLNTYNGIEFTDDEINRLILGNYSKEDEVHKRPLAKMYQDIGKDLGLIS